MERDASAVIAVFAQVGIQIWGTAFAQLQARKLDAQRRELHSRLMASLEELDALIPDPPSPLGREVVLAREHFRSCLDRNSDSDMLGIVDAYRQSVAARRDVAFPSIPSIGTLRPGPLMH
jgi:hypothetical protein